MTTHEEMRNWLARLRDYGGHDTSEAETYIAAAEQTERENERLRSEALLVANAALTRERDELKAKLADAERALVDLKVLGHGCNEGSENKSSTIPAGSRRLDAFLLRADISARILPLVRRTDPAER